MQDTNGIPDVFVHDRDADGNVIFDEPGGISTELVSVAYNGGACDRGAGISRISSDGRFVTFLSGSTNLLPGLTVQRGHVYVRDRLNGTTELASVSSSGVACDDGYYQPTISADGNSVAFWSLTYSDCLVPNDTNGMIGDAFIRNRQ